jgi:hypothetical protein
MPITYEAASGEEVYIKGSNQITTWELVSGQTWKAVVPDSTFGTFNPYSSVFSGDLRGATITWVTCTSTVRRTPRC